MAAQNKNRLVLYWLRGRVLAEPVMHCLSDEIIERIICTGANERLQSGDFLNR